MTTIRGLIAVDFSATVLYNIVKGDASILEFFQLPPCILSCIRPGIQRFDENMRSHGLEYILVLDGMPHPKKYVSILRRKESKDAVIEIYEILRIRPQENSLERIRKCWQKSRILSRPDIHTHVISILNDLGIAFRVAPFEADAEVVNLCQRGIAGYAMSTDGDIFVLGGAMVLYNWDFKEGTVNMVCNDLDSHRQLTVYLFAVAKPEVSVQHDPPIQVDSYYLTVLSN